MNQSKIKIAYIIDKLDIGGTEKQLVEMTNYLNKDTFDPIIITLRTSKSSLIDDLRLGLHVLDLYRLGSVRAVTKFVWLIRFLKRAHIDIVQTYFVDSTIFGVLAAKVSKVRSIISCRRDLGFWRTNSIVRKLRLINKFVDRFLVNSEAVKEDLARVERVPKEKIDVIYNGINLSNTENKTSKDKIRELYGIPSNEKVIGILANLNRPVKRVDLFIRAAACVLRKMPDVSFMILGDGYLMGSLKKLAEDLKISHKVIFAGSQREIYSLIGIWDIGVCASDSEGFSNAIIEYMGCGIPVIAMDVGGNRELIENGSNGILVPAGDYKALADSICELLLDEKRQNHIAQDAKRVIKEKYVWDRKIKEIEAYYLTILGEQ